MLVHPGFLALLHIFQKGVCRHGEDGDDPAQRVFAAADAAGGFCLFLSTVFGFPVSTTHTKTTAVMGVGAAKSLRSVDWSVAGDMAAAWLFTFPGCGILGWLISCIYLRVF